MALNLSAFGIQEKKKKRLDLNVFGIEEEGIPTPSVQDIRAREEEIRVAPQPEPSLLRRAVSLLPEKIEEKIEPLFEAAVKVREFLIPTLSQQAELALEENPTLTTQQLKERVKELDRARGITRTETGEGLIIEPPGLAARRVVVKGITKVSEPLVQQAQTMKIIPIDQAIKKFDATGSVTIATRADGARMVMKDEGDFVKVGIDLGEGKLVPTDIKLPEKNFATKEEAFDFVRGLTEKPVLKRPPSLEALRLRERPQKIIKREDVLLRGQVRAEARVAKQVFRETRRVEKDVARRQVQFQKREAARKVAQTRISITDKLRVAQEASQSIKREIVDYAKANLATKDRGKALIIVRDAKTSKDLIKSFARVNRWAEDAEKKSIRDEIIKTQKRITDSPSVAVDFKARVKEVLNEFELRGHTKSTIDKLRATEKFLAREAERGVDIEIPRRVLRSLDTLNRAPFEEVTTNQLTGALAEIELLEDLGRTKVRTIENLVNIQKEKVFSEIRDQVVEPLQNIELIRPEIGERLTITQKFRNTIHSVMNRAAQIDKAISPMDVVFDLLDGGKATYGGANFRFFKARVDAGHGRYLTRKDTLQNPVVELATRRKLDERSFERMGVVAAREQDGGLEKLLASRFTQEEVSAVKLTVQEQEVLNLMRRTFDSQFSEIKDVMRRVYNQPVEKVKNYFSFMTDWKAMDDMEVFQRFGSQNPEQFGAPTKNVEIGFTKTRVGKDQKIKINAMDVFLKHTDNTSYLLELGETTKVLGEISASPQYAELVGDAGQLLVREWVDVVARKGGAAGASEIPLLDTLRRNVGAGILGLKLSTIAIQPTALIDGMGFIGTRYGMRGVKEFSTSAEWRNFIVNMPEIKDRMGGEFALRELTDNNWLQRIQRKGFIPLQALDRYTAGMVANGAYIQKMDELGLAIDLTKGYNDEALKYAQLAVRRTQSSGAFKDVPLAVSRGALTGNRSLDRAMLQFQNFLLTRWSRIRHDAFRAGIRTKDPKKAAAIFTAIIMASIAASGNRLGVNKAIDFVTGREDKDTVSEDLTRGFIYEMTGNVPFLGTAASMAIYDGEMFPILDAPKGVISGLNRVITSTSPEAKLRGFTEFAGSTGAILGIPGSLQAEQFARGFLQREDRGISIPSIEIPGIEIDIPSIKIPSISI